MASKSHEKRKSKRVTENSSSSPVKSSSKKSVEIGETSQSIKRTGVIDDKVERKHRVVKKTAQSPETNSDVVTKSSSLLKEKHIKDGRAIKKRNKVTDNNKSSEEIIRTPKKLSVKRSVTKEPKQLAAPENGHNSRSRESNHKSNSRLREDTLNKNRTHKPSKSESTKLSKHQKVIEDSYNADDNENSYEDDFEEYESDFEDESPTITESDDSDNNLPNELKSSGQDIQDVLHNKLVIESISDGGELVHDGQSESALKISHSEEIVDFLEENWSKQHLNPPLLKGASEENGSTNTASQVVLSPNEDLISTSGTIPPKTERQHSSPVKTSTVNKIKNRGDALLDLITLDEDSFILFTLTPRSYEEFMSHYGNTNSKQIYTQTGDDCVVEETQTDDIEVSEVWTQHPPSVNGAVGGETFIQSQNVFQINYYKDLKRLGQFTQEASQIMCALIDEDKHSQDRNLTCVQKDLAFSEKTLYLNVPPFANGCEVSFLATCKLLPEYLLVIYRRILLKENNVNQNKEVICMWNSFQPIRPHKYLQLIWNTHFMLRILTTNLSKPLCCCFSQSATHAFAGLEDGSISVWDLREPERLHQKVICDDVEYIFRSPTYNTAEVIGDDGHHSPVVAITSRTTSKSIASPVNQHVLHSNGIVQLATLEENAILCVWVVAELSHSDEAGDETDLGLAPNGKVRLVKSTSVCLDSIPNLHSRMQMYPRTLDFACHSRDMNQFYIAIDMGLVVLCSVTNSKCKIFTTSEGYVNVTSEATSLSLSSFGDPFCFLVGCSDGSVRLHTCEKEKPLMVWTAAENNGICKVAWSESCPNIFYLLDNMGVIQVWDLCHSDCEPVATTKNFPKKINYFAVGCGKNVSSKNSLSKPYIAFGCDDGTIEIHYLSNRYSRTGTEECDLFRKYVELL